MFPKTPPKLFDMEAELERECIRAFVAFSAPIVECLFVKSYVVV